MLRWSYFYRAESKCDPVIRAGSRWSRTEEFDLRRDMDELSLTREWNEFNIWTDHACSWSCTCTCAQTIPQSTTMRVRLGAFIQVRLQYSGLWTVSFSDLILWPRSQEELVSFPDLPGLGTRLMRNSWWWQRSLRRLAAGGGRRRAYSAVPRSSSVSPLRVCVVGSGPAGFYTAHQLTKVGS